MAEQNSFHISEEDEKAKHVYLRFCLLKGSKLSTEDVHGGSHILLPSLIPLYEWRVHLLKVIWLHPSIFCLVDMGYSYVKMNMD